MSKEELELVLWGTAPSPGVGLLPLSWGPSQPPALCSGGGEGAVP